MYVRVPREKRHADQMQILQFRIYADRAVLPPEDVAPRPLGKRLCYFDHPLDVDEEITRYLDSQRGKMAIAGKHHL